MQGCQSLTKTVVSQVLFYGLLLTIANVANGAQSNAVFTKGVPSTVSAEQAILASAAGEVVYKCQPVEMKVSKSGTSISMKNVKKKITAEEAEAKIDEIKKQVGQ